MYQFPDLLDRVLGSNWKGFRLADSNYRWPFPVTTLQRMRESGVFELETISFPPEHRERIELVLESKDFPGQFIGASPMQVKGGGAQTDLLPESVKLRV